MTEENFQTLCEVDTLLTSDCVEFCPCEPFQQFLICGCYQLEESTRTRHGRLILSEVSKSAESNLCCLEERQVLDVVGVFDCKWSPSSLEEKPILGTVDADGAVSLYELTSGENGKKTLQLKKRAKYSDQIETEIMGLSMDWSNRLTKNHHPQIIASYNNGYLATWEVTLSRILVFSLID